MTTIASVTTARKWVPPKAFCQRRKIRPGPALRVIEVGAGLNGAPVTEQRKRELKQVLATAGSLDHQQTNGEELGPPTIVDRALPDDRLAAC